MSEVEIIPVVRTTLARRGKGVQGDPIRIITQYWSTEGELMWESDPYLALRVVDEWRPIDTFNGDGPVIVFKKGWLPHTANRAGDKWMVPGTGAVIPFQPSHWRDILPGPSDE